MNQILRHLTCFCYRLGVVLSAFGPLGGMPAAAQNMPPAPVVVAAIQQQEVDDQFSTVGTVHPRRFSSVASEAEGRVAARYRDTGQRVGLGEALIRLENPRYEAAMLEALADEKLRSFNLEHASALFRDGATSEQAFRDAEYERDRAKSKLGDYRSRLRALTVRSPFSGHVVQILVELGEWVNRGDSVAQIVRTDTVRIHAEVPEKHVNHIRLGSRVDIVLEALGSGANVQGNVVAVAPDGRSEAHTFPVIVEVLNPEQRIRSRMTARLRFDFHGSGPRLMIHKDAVVNGAAGPVLYLAADGKAVATPLTLGLRHNDLIEVKGKLQAGDLAIVRGNERLRDGQPIRITRKHQ